jgi:transposase InsO family protein
LLAGLIPSEHSSGGHTQRGGITKTGNGHARRVLIECAWHYRHQARVSRALHQRREGQPARLITIADKAHRRLSGRYRRMTTRGKEHNKVVVAIARESGSPWENGYVESFNGKLRDECLNGEVFETLLEAPVLIERWRHEYNTFRPHSSLGYWPPAPEARIFTPNLQ